MPAAARTLAFDLLQKVEAGGYASDLLRGAELDSRGEVTLFHGDECVGNREIGSRKGEHPLGIRDG